MRYFFDTELDLICKQVGFVIKQKYEWMSVKNPNSNNKWRQRHTGSN